MQKKAKIRFNTHLYIHTYIFIPFLFLRLENFSNIFLYIFFRQFNSCLSNNNFIALELNALQQLNSWYAFSARAQSK